jgi:hypothetical protein
MEKLYMNPNETYPYKIMRKTGWSKGSRIELPSRLVLISYYRGKDAKPKYAVRWQTKPKRGPNPVGNGPTFGGDAFSDWTQANLMFVRKYHEHNADYPRGNVSHLPGISNPKNPRK